MSQPRSLPLLDLKAQPQSWNERMAPGEFAVLFTGIPPTAGFNSQTCTVFDSLDPAVAYSTELVALWPEMRCRIYTHEGFGTQPVREICGTAHRKDSEISARMRRWGGSVLFVGGATLFLLDVTTDYSRLWPSMLGMRLMPVGLVLLVTELVIVIEARRKLRRSGRA